MQARRVFRKLSCRRGWLRPAVLLLAALLLPVLLPACKGSSDDGGGRRTLTVSVAPQKYLLSAIVDTLYDINVLIPPGADAETFDPPMQTLRDVGRSEALFAVGAAGFEKATLERLSSNFPDLRVIDSSQGILLIRDTHGDGEPDPHIWSSVKNARTMARTMLDEMCRLDPANADTFRANYLKLEKSLSDLDIETSERIAAGPRAFAVQHPSFSYFARDYGLKQLPLEEHGREASPKQYKERLDAVRASKAKVFVAEPSMGADKAKAVAAQAGLSDVVTVNLSGDDWPDQIRKLSQALAR